MEIVYSPSKLSKTVATEKDALKHYGDTAKRILQRIAELRASDTLATLYTLPAARCHALSGNRNGQFAITVSGNARIIFTLNEDPIPLTDDGAIDRTRVSRICIIAIGEDYH